MAEMSGIVASIEHAPARDDRLMARTALQQRQTFHWLLAGLFCVAFWPLTAPAESVQMQHTGWGAAGGAPADIWAIEQAKDGYPWLGTAKASTVLMACDLNALWTGKACPCRLATLPP